MSDSSSNPPSRRQLAPAIVGSWVVFVLFGFFSLVLLCVGLVWIKYPTTEADKTSNVNYEKQRADARLAARLAITQEGDKLKTNLAWVDQGKGVVRIKLDWAKEIIIAQSATNKPHAGKPIVVAAPAPAAPVTPTNAPATGVPAAAPAPSPATNAPATPKAAQLRTPVGPMAFSRAN